MVWGGDAALTLAYRPRHPNIRFMKLRFPSRGIELGTERQYYLWRFISGQIDGLPDGKSWRTSLAKLAAAVGLSRSQVSRFLRKLDWWRAIDLCAIPGRGGAIYIWNSPSPGEEIVIGPPHVEQRVRFKMLRHRVWQSRFDAWRERYEEVREMAKHHWQTISNPVNCSATFAK